LAKKICFVGVKGGVGTTTVCINVAEKLADMGERVLVIDGDTACSSACTACDCATAHVYTLGDVQSGICRTKQAIVQHPRHYNLFIASSRGCTDKGVFLRTIEECDSLFDFILCDDCGESACQKVLVITEPYLLSIKSADATICRLKTAKKEEVEIVVNKICGGQIFDGEIMTPQEIASLLHAPLFAVVPEDLRIALGTPNEKTQKAFKIFANRIKNGGDKIYNCTKKYLGILGAFRRAVRKRI